MAYSALCFFRQPCLQRIFSLGNEVVFSGMPAYAIIFSFIEAYWRILRHFKGMFRLIQAYPVTLAHSQSCHILSPSIFWTEGLFKTLWNVDQTYSEPCHRALFSHIQNLLQRSHTQKLGILGILEYSEPFNSCNLTGIQNPAILTKIYEYSELCHF